MRATIKDVSRVAGVSIKTVSRVLNKEKYVRDDTRKNVFRRLAVMTHGNVLMAPLIQDEIAGGELTIGADPDLPCDLKRS